MLQALDLLGHLLAVLDVVPEAVLLRLGLQVLQLLAVLGDAQGLLQLAQSGLRAWSFCLYSSYSMTAIVGRLLIEKNSLAYLL